MLLHCIISGGNLLTKIDALPSSPPLTVVLTSIPPPPLASLELYCLSSAKNDLGDKTRMEEKKEEKAAEKTVNQGNETAGGEKGKVARCNYSLLPP